MAAPVYQASGATQAATTAVTVGWPSHQVNDLAILAVQTSNEAATLTTANGFVALGTSIGIGTPASAGATRLTLFYCFATSTAMASPVVADSGNHQVAVINTYRGVYIGGPPMIGGHNTATTSTSVSVPGGITTTDECLIAAYMAHAVPVNGPHYTAQANASLTSVAERFDNASNTGTGGGISVATGILALKGSYDATTATLDATSAQENYSIILPSLAVGQPDVQIVSTPVVICESNDATFTFTITEGAAEYDVDGDGFASAVSPIVLTDLDEGVHVLTIRSVDDVDSQAVFTWTVASADAVAPTLIPVSPDPGEIPGSPGAFSATYSTAKSTPIVVRFEDVGNGIGFMMVAARISTEGSHFTLVYVGTGSSDGFSSPYSSHSSIVADGGDYVLSIRHDDDWPKSSLIRLRTRAVDLSGNVMP